MGRKRTYPGVGDLIMHNPFWEPKKGKKKKGKKNGQAQDDGSG